MNVSNLRRHIGVVNQEPVLFSMTISENIAFGREGVTQLEIENAAKIANAHDFILRFPKVRLELHVYRQSCVLVSCLNCCCGANSSDILQVLLVYIRFSQATIKPPYRQ